jgi:Zn-dependent peptidase ImmA (M78 family)
LVQKLGIELVNADLTDARVAGFSLADDVHGPTIVVNARGQNSNPWVRRFTIAHELCHVLHDEKMHREVSPVQYYDEDGRVGPEPRANAFAAVLLAPDDGIRELLGNMPKQSLANEVRTVMGHFGINFKTARYRLRHAWNAPERQLSELRGVPTEPASDEWRIAEAFWDAEYFACPTVPMERRGLLARRVVEAWSKKLFDRRQALELLHAAPDEPLEALRELPELN